MRGAAGARTLPLYTRKLSLADLGVAETVLTFIILGSIVLRGGLGEALIRLWFTEDTGRPGADGADRAADRGRDYDAVALLALPRRRAARRPAVRRRDAGIGASRSSASGASMNLETAYALLRVQERRRTYLARPWRTCCSPSRSPSPSS